MNVAILAYTLDTYATKKLVSQFKLRGHQVVLASPLDCRLEIASENSSLLHKDSSFPAIDVVMLRGLTYFDNGMVVPRIIETAMVAPFIKLGALCFNSPESKTIAANKLTSIQVLSNAGIPIPKTVVSWKGDGFDSVVGALGTPLVFKMLDGTWGAGVTRCDSVESARSMFDVLRAHGHAFLIQENVSSPLGQIIRALVVGDQVLGSIACTPRLGEFRSNIAQGASAKPISLTAASEQLAITSARSLGLDIAGVDLVETSAGPLILEVNSVPGLEAIDQLCALNTSFSIVQLIEDRYETQRLSKRGCFTR